MIQKDTGGMEPHVWRYGKFRSGNGNQKRTDRNCPASPQRLIATSGLAGDRLWLKKLRQVITDCKINSKDPGWQRIRFFSAVNGDGESPALFRLLDCSKRKKKTEREGGGKIKALGLGFPPPPSIH